MWYRTKEFQVFSKKDWVTQAMPVKWVAEVWNDWWRKEMEDRFVKFDTREHRHYRFEHDLDFNWWLFDDYNNLDNFKYWLDDEDRQEITEEAEAQIKKLDDNYYRWFVDCYDHSAISFSLAWQWMQDRRDTASRCWIIACPKAYNGYDLKEWNESPNKEKWEKVELTLEEAEKEVIRYLWEYNEYINWRWPLEIFLEYEEEYVSTKWNGNKIKDRCYLEDSNLWIYYNRDIDDAEKDILEEAEKYLDEEHIEHWELSLSVNDIY